MSAKKRRAINLPPPGSEDIRESLEKKKANSEDDRDDAVIFKSPDNVTISPQKPKKNFSLPPEEETVNIVLGNQVFLLRSTENVTQEDIDGLVENEIASADEISQGNKLLRRLQHINPKTAKQLRSGNKCSNPKNWWTKAIDRIDAVFASQVRRFMNTGGKEEFLRRTR